MQHVHTRKLMYVHILVRIFEEKCKEIPKYRYKVEQKRILPCALYEAYGDGGISSFILIIRH
jgi:hypothetical protein